MLFHRNNTQEKNPQFPSGENLLFCPTLITMLQKRFNIISVLSISKILLARCLVNINIKHHKMRSTSSQSDLPKIKDHIFWHRVFMAITKCNITRKQKELVGREKFYMFLLWKKSNFLLCIACYFCYGLNHTPAYLFRGLIPFTYLYPNVAQNKSVSWSLTTSTWLFHWHIKNQCHNATLFCFDCGLNKSSHKK